MSTLGLSPSGGDEREVATAVNNLLNGKLNSIGEVTLTDSQTTTTLSDRRLGPDSVVLLVPLTSNAADAAIAGIYVSARTNGSCTLNHASDVDTDQDFAYAILG